MFIIGSPTSEFRKKTGSEGREKSGGGPFRNPASAKIGDQKRLRLIMDFMFEGDCDRRKADWQSRHRWRTPEPELSFSLTGPINRAAVDEIAADIECSSDAPVVLNIHSAGGDAWQA
jgi:hypothetical protein